MPKSRKRYLRDKDHGTWNWISIFQNEGSVRVWEEDTSIARIYFFTNEFDVFPIVAYQVLRIIPWTRSMFRLFLAWRREMFSRSSIVDESRSANAYRMNGPSLLLPRHSEATEFASIFAPHPRSVLSSSLPLPSFPAPTLLDPLHESPGM